MKLRTGVDISEVAIDVSMGAPPKTSRSHRLRTGGIIVLVLVVLLVVGRAILPSVLKRYVNRTLAGLEGYSGRVSDIDLSLWRGAP